MNDVRITADRGLTALVLLAPGVLLVVLALHSGGFFPDWSATATLAVLVLLLLRATLGTRAFAGISTGLLVAGAALTAFTLWVLVSGAWSSSWSRALLEYARDLGYLVVLVLFGLLGRTPGRARLLVGGLALGAVVIGALALIAWLRPDVLAVGDGFGRQRLSWPLSYWNTTGLIAAFGALWCFHLSCADPSRLVRTAATAAVPVLVPVLFFTASRGAAFAGLAGVAVYLLAGPSRGVLTGIAACAPAALLSAGAAARLDGLNQVAPSPAALADARQLAVHVVLLAAGAAALRAALLPVDRRLARLELGPRFARRAWAAAAAGAAVLLVAAVAAGGANRARDAYAQVTADRNVPSAQAPAERFRQLSANGRIAHWRVAMREGFDQQPLHGTGAGTYALLWARGRDSSFVVVDGHSLYVEVLAELGIVGLALLAVALAAMLVALARRTRGDAGPVWAVLLATVVAWALRAGVDWDWEMPAATAWVFAAGGLALAAPATASPRDPAVAAGALPVRVAVALGCLLLALVPAAVLRSQTALADAVSALRAGDCPQTVDRALAASQALGPRPEPFELLAWCDVRLGRPELARTAIAAAIRRDPHNWEFRYDDALIRAATGRDPRPPLAAAAARNPRAGLVVAAEPLLGRGAQRRRWRAYGRHAPLPLPENGLRR